MHPTYSYRRALWALPSLIIFCSFFPGRTTILNLMSFIPMHIFMFFYIVIPIWYIVLFCGFFYTCYQQYHSAFISVQLAFHSTLIFELCLCCKAQPQLPGTACSTGTRRLSYSVLPVWDLLLVILFGNTDSLAVDLCPGVWVFLGICLGEKLQSCPWDSPLPPALPSLAKKKIEIFAWVLFHPWNKSLLRFSSKRSPSPKVSPFSAPVSNAIPFWAPLTCCSF